MRYFFIPGGNRVWADVAVSLKVSSGWSPGIWSAPVAAAEVRQSLAHHFPDATVLEKHPRHHISPGDYSTRELRAAEGFLASRIFYENQEALLAELDRHTDFRFWAGDGRENTLRLVCLRLLRYFEKHRVRALVAAETPHLLVPHLALLIAEYRELPVLFFHPIPYCPALMPMKGIGIPFTGSSTTWSLASETDEFQAKVLSYLHSELDQLETGEGATYMVRAKKGPSHSPIIFLLAGMFEALKSVVLAPLKLQSFLDFQADKISKQILFWRRAALLVSSRRLGNDHPVWSGKIATLFLHYEPERNSSPEGRPFNTGIRAVLGARTVLPHDFLLRVKDHPSQYRARLWGFKRRSEMFFALVRSLAATTPVSHSSEAIDDISKSDLVVTVNGNVGVESALNGTPVLHLGSPWWQGMPGSIALSSFQPERLPKPVDSKKIREFLEELIRRKCIPGVSSLKLGKLWEISDSDAIFWEAQRQSLVGVTLAFFASAEEEEDAVSKPV